MRRITPLAAARAAALVVALAAAPSWSAGLAAQLPSATAVYIAMHAVVPPAPARDSSSRDPAELDAVARRYAASVRNCYQEQGLKEDPALSGLLRVEVMVLPTGGVQAAAATATRVSGTGMPAVASCVSTAARAWRFRQGAPRTERVVLEYDLLPP
jgi:hypothetical protein